MKSIRVLWLVLILTGAGPDSARADKAAYTVSGEVLFSGQGDIKVYLVDARLFRVPYRGIKTLVITPAPGGGELRRVDFHFDGVEPGVYGIRCFQASMAVDISVILR